MTDLDPQVETVPVVGDLPVEQFLGILTELLDRRRKDGDPKLLDLSVKEFQDHLLEYTKTRSYLTAQVEAETAERILTDWRGLQAVEAVTQPFRLSSDQDIDAFCLNLKESMGAESKVQFVVAVAIARPNGTYQKK